jgi:hypothetical protein
VGNSSGAAEVVLADRNFGHKIAGWSLETNNPRRDLESATKKL